MVGTATTTPRLRNAAQSVVRVWWLTPGIAALGSSLWLSRGARDRDPLEGAGRIEQRRLFDRREPERGSGPHDAGPIATITTSHRPTWFSAAMPE